MTLASPQHIEATQRFIDENPRTFVLTRGATTSDGAGGRVPSSSSTVTIQGRLVNVGDPKPRVGLNGVEVLPGFALIALPSADVRVGDEFTLDNRVHEVVFVSTNPEWRKSAEVFRHGG